MQRFLVALGLVAAILTNAIALARHASPIETLRGAVIETAQAAVAQRS